MYPIGCPACFGNPHRIIQADGGFKFYKQVIFVMFGYLDCVMFYTLFLISQVRGGDGRAQLLNMVQPDSLVQDLQKVCESVAPKSQQPPVVDGDQGGCSSSFKAERAGMFYETTLLFFFSISVFVFVNIQVFDVECRQEHKRSRL
jgi:hypothetical protein